MQKKLFLTVGITILATLALPVVSFKVNETQFKSSSTNASRFTARPPFMAMGVPVNKNVFPIWKKLMHEGKSASKVSLILGIDDALPTRTLQLRIGEAEENQRYVPNRNMLWQAIYRFDHGADIPFHKLSNRALEAYSSGAMRERKIDGTPELTEI